MPGILDHLIMLLIIVGAPLDGVVERRKLARAQVSGAPGAKLDGYARIMRWQWGAAIVLLGYWLLVGRSVDTLGFRAVSGVGLAWSIGACLVVTLVMSSQERSVRRRPGAAVEVKRQAASLDFMVPKTNAEVRRFTWLGITAGIVEELLCRGFMIWYLMAYMAPWLAVIVSSVVFGVGHLYQGPAGVLKTMIAGLLFGTLYRLSGALWAPMYVHAAVDVFSGRLIYFAFQQDPTAEETSTAQS